MALTHKDNQIVSGFWLVGWFGVLFVLVLLFFNLVDSVLHLFKTKQLSVYPAIGATGIQLCALQFQNMFTAWIKHHLKDKLKVRLAMLFIKWN